MKVFQFKHQETFILDAALSEEHFIGAYHKLFDDLLLIKNIARSRIFVSINSGDYNLTSSASQTESLLRKKNLPPFCFLVCTN
jgi:hypothetical protein